MKDKGALVLFLVLLLSVGAGFGGYYLGKYLDVKALESKSNIDNTNTIKWNEYSGKAFNAYFTYPSNWSVSEVKEKDSKNRDVNKIIVKGPKGSQLIISSTTGVTNDQKYELYCDKTKPEGDDNTIQECIFIQEGEYSLARFIPIDGIKDGVTTWYSSSTVKDSKYVWDNVKNVVYSVKDSSEITTLDGIMISLGYVKGE